MNNFWECEKTKPSKIFHNYAISTKNFDGNLLYELFMSNTRQNKTQSQHRKFEVKFQSKIQVRSPSRTFHKIESVKKGNESKCEQKVNRVMRIITTQYERKRQSTQLVCSKLPPQQVVNRQSISGQNFYDRILYRSMQSNKIKPKEQKEQKEQRISQILSKTQSVHFNNKGRRLISRKKQRLKVQDFVKPQKIEADPWIQGKMIQFSAQSISIISNNKRIYSYQGDIVREIASLTKIMSCITALYLAKKYQLDIAKQQVKVTRNAANLNGTTAQLSIGDILSIKDLLYAMMLPSGNDASQALADFFHKFILQKAKDQTPSLNINQRQKVVVNNDSTKDLRKTNISSQHFFVKQMNNLAQHLKMKNTNFDCPHGLSNKNNYSTSNDIVELCHYAMKNEQFRTIVRSISFETKVYSSRQKVKRPIKWLNTNKLLSLEHCQGIKTGITPTAGPCMAASFKRQKFNIQIVILNAKSKSKRFQEVKNLYQWALKQAIF